MGVASVEYDPSIPVLLLKIGRYPLSHGTLGAIRSLGRVGVPVYAIAEDRCVPYAYSRYLRGRILLPTTGREEGHVLLHGISQIASGLGARCVLLPTDDEAAIFVAEHGVALRDQFLLPNIEPTLPRALASKRGLDLLCRRHGVPVPATEFAQSVADVRAFAVTAQFPIVVKNSEPWVRITRPAVKATTIVASRDALISLTKEWTGDPLVILQEYIPKADAEDWIFHAYFDQRSEPLVAFTGVKQRSWPPHAGVTAAAIAVPNSTLSDIATAFCRAIAYRGIVDMDWRLDRRDGRYKLVDFNPRMGANFRLFVSESQVDVVRAQHLDLTGRTVTGSRQDFGRRFVVENLNLASRLAGGATASMRSSAPLKTERAWFAADDLMPFLLMAVRFGGQVFRRLGQFAVGKGRRIAAKRRRRAKVGISVDDYNERATALQTVRAANSAPHTNRIRGPNVGAADSPVK